MKKTKKTRSKTGHIIFPWEKDLNPDQRKAVETINGPVLVLAGAGSGKTRVIAYRIAYLVASQTVSPDKILALTFTNKAANEMKERILKLIPGNNLNLWMGTFHSVFSRILRREAKKLGFTSQFTIYDTQDQKRALKEVLKKQNLITGELSNQDILNTISFCKSRLINHSEYESESTDSYKQRIVAPIYNSYSKLLKNNNAMDFDDLLMNTYQLFQNNPEVLKSYKNRFKYLLVDEFQDTNLAQYRILLQLSLNHKNICVVGDDDQSIYRWRGAEIKNILQFEHDFPGTSIFRLEQNYRSTKTILKAANSVIKNNRVRHAKALWTEKGYGKKVRIFSAHSDINEAAWIAKNIQSEVFRDKWTWGNFAILYRLNSQSRLLEDNLRRSNIPYKVIGGLKFYDRKEVKDVLAYLCLLVNPNDSISLKRVINFPPRGVGKQTINKLESYSDKNDLTLLENLKKADEIQGISAKRASALIDFHDLIIKYKKLCKKVSLKELVSTLIEEVQIPHTLMMDGAQESLSRIENVNELIRAIDEYVSVNEKATLEDYLSEIALITDIDTWNESQQHVTLMTVHSAKGLEFPVVYLTGLEEGIFPVASSLDDPEALEEERRLFYVGATRAMEILHISFSYTRGIFGEITENPPSRFLNEVDEECIYYPEKEVADISDMNKTRALRYDKRIARKKVIESDSKYSAGMKVKHSEFGRGIIISVEGRGESTKLKVLFDGKSMKNLLAQYASLLIE
ncbi:ATP-dependent helicase [candidate division KSB1 bacterium]